MEKRTSNEQHISRLLPKSKATQDYSHIELTEEEVERALRYARMTKARTLEEQEEAEKRRRVITESQMPWSTEELRDNVLDKAAGLPFRFKIDGDNEEVFNLLCLYFSNNPEFEKRGAKNENGEIIQPYSLSKGICLHSVERGTGKTVFMELFAQNKKNCFAIVSTAKISSFYQADGDVVLSRFSAPWQAEREARFFFQSPVGICFDDLGDEEDKLHYGNRENVMNRILTRLYSEYPDKSVFKFFHATTNLTGPQLEEKYDRRVRSRMREMFNWIVLPGKDRRV